jgi:outer membrane receptor protein involved in Fe transport
MRLNYYLFCFMLTNCLTAQAQQNSVQELAEIFSLSLEELQQVRISVASRSEEIALKAPAKVKIITRQQIATRGYVNLFDLLRDQAGIDTQVFSHETTYNQIALRGVVGNNRFLILQDGLRIDSPAGDPIAIASNFPLFNVERVEIAYGPASALYGADAFTGVINIVTTSDAEQSPQAGISFADYGYRYIYAKAKIALAKGVDLSLAFHSHTANNPDLSEYYPSIFAQQDLIRSNGTVAVPAAQRASYYGKTESDSLSIKLDVNKKFSVGVHQSRFASPTTIGLEPSTVDYAAKAEWDTTLGSVYARYHHTFDNKSSMRVQGNYQYYEVDESSKFNNIFSNFEDGYKYADVDKIQIEAQFDYRWEQSKLIVGINSEHYTTLSKTADLATPYDPNRTTAEQSLFYGGTNQSIPVKVYDSEYTNYGFFTHFQTTFSQTFDGIMGVRFDENSRYGGSVNPRVGLVYTPQENLTLKILYGEAFLAPAPELTYEHFGTFSGKKNSEGLYTSEFFFIPNTNLKPEEIGTLETNITYIPSENLVLDASLYRSTVSQFILNTSTPTPVSDFIDGGTIAFTSHNDNVGNLEVLGADFEINYQAEFNSSTMNIWGNYSYVDGDFIDKTRNLKVSTPFTSKNKIKMGISFRYEQDYYISSTLHWIDDASTDTPNIGPGSTKPKSAASYVLVGLNAGIDNIIPHLSFSLKVENLFDKRYFNAGTGVNITFAESPQNPRIITLGLRYQL